MLIMKIRASLVFLVLLGMIVSISGARAQSDREETAATLRRPLTRYGQTSMKISSSSNCWRITSNGTPRCSATQSRGLTK